MPRPRVIRVNKGQVIVKNLSREEADNIERFLTTPAPDRFDVVFNEDKYEYELVENKDPFLFMDLSHTALGMYSDESGFYAVEISYNPEKEVGKVVEKKFLHKNINHARAAFNVIFNKKFL